MGLDIEYKMLVERALQSRYKVKSRNGYIRPLINEQLTINLGESIFGKEGSLFPILTTKKIFWKKAIAEFCWIFNGETNIDFLHKYGIKWWDEWANLDNEINYSYGHQVRSFNSRVDQIKYVERELEKEHSRRAHITLWNPSELPHQPLPCCYTGFDFYKFNGELHTVMNFRSSDIFLGLPYDIIVGAMFAYYFAHKQKLSLGKLHMSLSNAHLYVEHEEQARELLDRTGRYCKPKLIAKNWDGKLDPDDFEVTDYKSEPLIEAKMIC